MFLFLKQLLDKDGSNHRKQCGVAKSWGMFVFRWVFLCIYCFIFIQMTIIEELIGKIKSILAVLVLLKAKKSSRVNLRKKNKRNNIG